VFRQWNSGKPQVSRDTHIFAKQRHSMPMRGCWRQETGAHVIRNAWAAILPDAKFHAQQSRDENIA
jgi:hypothetical protein